MPGREDCHHCPLRGDLAECIVVRMGSAEHPFCGRVDPASPMHNPKMAEKIAKLSRGEPPITLKQPAKVCEEREEPTATLGSLHSSGDPSVRLTLGQYLAF